MNQDDKIKKKVVRRIGGIAFAIVFAIFAYLSCKAAPQSDEVFTVYTEDANKAYGTYREKFLERQPKLKVPNKLKEADEAAEAELAAVSEPIEVAEEELAEETATVEEATEQTELSHSAQKAAELGLPAPPEIDITEWQYLLVNSTHTLTSDYAPPEIAYLNQTADETDIQTTYNANRCPVDSRIAQALLDFATGCKEAGVPVYLSSGYRSYDEQNYLYERKISQGYDAETAKTIVAYPGTSEHQTGLSCDITDYYRELKDSSLEQTDTYKWLCANCADYGFIVRYPADKSGSADSVTGVIYEPWHFRYVGVEAAKYITENNLCLEEFVELYE